MEGGGGGKVGSPAQTVHGASRPIWWALLCDTFKPTIVQEPKTFPSFIAQNRPKMANGNRGLWGPKWACRPPPTQSLQNCLKRPGYPQSHNFLACS